MTSPTEPSTPGARQAPVMPDLSEFLDNPGKPPRDRSTRSNRPTLLAGVVLGGLLLLGAGFAAGRVTAPKGPTTLVAAIQEASTGKLPCGTPTTNANFVQRLCSNGGTAANGANGGTGGQLPGGQAGQGQAGQGQAGQRGGVGGLFGPGAVNGTIASVSGSTLTIATRAGDVPITLPAGASLTKAAPGTAADLGKGLPVVVSTTTDASGKRTATQVFILPASAAPATAPTG